MRNGLFKMLQELFTKQFSIDFSFSTVSRQHRPQSCHSLGQQCYGDTCMPSGKSCMHNGWSNMPHKLFTEQFSLDFSFLQCLGNIGLNLATLLVSSATVTLVCLHELFNGAVGVLYTFLVHGPIAHHVRIHMCPAYFQTLLFGITCKAISTQFWKSIFFCWNANFCW